MPSIRQQIVNAIQASLQAAGGPAGLTVYRELNRPVEADALPAIAIRVRREPKPEPLAHSGYRAPLVERQMTVILELRAEGNTSTPTDVALDALYVWACQRMFTDVSFGGLANEVVEEEKEWESQEGNIPIASCAAQFLVKYRTSRLDPSSANTV